jgi:glycerophosphoryl diester phosphodiesterase
VDASRRANLANLPRANTLFLLREYQVQVVVRRLALNIAHRGASGTFPENTLSAFRAAIEAGADMCELDVQLTRDGAVVVIHDDTVERTCDGAGTVAKLTLAELKRFDAGAKFQNGRIRGEHIPTLDEVFAVTADKCGLNIELKVKGVEARVAEIIRRNNALETALVSSFDWKSIIKLHEIDAAVRFGLLAEEKPQLLLGTAIQMKAESINPRDDMITAEMCDAAHAHGIKVITWTVNASGAMRTLIDLGVDGIITNFPERMAMLAQH